MSNKICNNNQNPIFENFTLIDTRLEKAIKKSIFHVDNRKELIGKIAIFTGIISFFPIMYKMWITKNHSNFTWGNLLLALISNLAWIYYGFVANTSANLWSGILFFSIYTYIMMFKIFYPKN
jgi:uncharacterized protein with PQ loop repeat